MADLDIQEKIELSDEQKLALRELYEFPFSDDSIIGLSGPGGSGKTFILNSLLDLYDKSCVKYMLCAPTNKAANIMTSYTNREAATIHGLLRLSPNTKVLALDYRDLKFCKPMLFTTPSILIIDEASMVTRLLYDYLRKCYNKIIIIGDTAQLGPVNDEFNIFRNVRTYYLTRIFRQSEDNPISETLKVLRERPIRQFEKRSGIYEVTDDIKEFVNNVVDEIKEREDSVVVCYTNKRVDLYNKVIKNALFGESKEIVKGLKVIGASTSGGITNGYIYTVTHAQTEMRNIANIGKIKGVTVMLNNGKTNITQFVLDSSSPLLPVLGEKLESIRLAALNKKIQWSYYYAVYGSFSTMVDVMFEGRVVKPATIKYAYAITAHKAQGSGYDSVSVDMRDMVICREDEELRQLQYVAFSRTKNKVRVLI